MRLSKSVCFALLFAALNPQFCDAQAPQRDASVTSCYVSPIAVEAKDEQLHLKFDLNKMGGPHEHTEYQCYLLLYLAKDEPQILKTLADPKATRKDRQAAHPFLHEWIDSGIVMELGTQLATARKNAEPGLQFPYEFDFKLTDLFNTLEELKHFSAMNAESFGRSKLYRDEFRIAAFVPLNDSIYANEVEPRMRESPDFAGAFDTDTSVLWLRAFPYRFSLIRYPGKLRININ